MSILIVVGTRPEIIKMAPVIKELERRGLGFSFIYTGQHYDYEMSRVFIEELELPQPHTSFVLNNRNPAAQVGEMMIKLEKALEKLGRHRVMLIQGDTNTMLAAGLTALKLGIKLGHVEAGLRSYDWKMPEEHNRRMIDQVSDYLFAPTEIARRNLLEEHVWGEIHVTGNTVIDALDIYFDRVKEVEQQVLEKIRFNDYILVTFHRAENVDNSQVLRDFIRILQRSPLPIVFPIHPRTEKRLQEYGLRHELQRIRNLQVIPPQGYFEFLALMKNCRIVLTDSGGLQEEATHPKIRKPILVLRSSTERPEAVAHGFARVVGVNPVVVLTELEKAVSEEIKLPEFSPFGDGKAARRIVEITKSKLEMLE
ncbi:UDP-N-acetylglucosamine 2-epimerase (non-hydrolyzing) [Candidatus Bathyarchaeota archaeon]|nr:MAG: UDP-N-acetylglucosamine 2-epimerase (non-hydrolyzing) [Candidatus Bathyarchaeota archaeon]